MTRALDYFSAIGTYISDTHTLYKSSTYLINIPPLHGQIKVPHCGITWIYHRWLLSFPGYTPDVCGLFIKTCKNKLVEYFYAYGVIKGEQINILHRNHDRLAVF